MARFGDLLEESPVSKYVYGPVPSRRLGRSLGVDLVPAKTCSLNCIYCQLGPTAETTIERGEYAPREEIVSEVREAVERPSGADYITLAGSGEPTLHSSFGWIASQIKTFTKVPIVLLTNGTLFHLPEVRAACRDVDLVVPSLDAGDETQFRYINRPHPDLALEGLVDGLVKLREEFKGEIWLEVFVLFGVNSFDADVEKIKKQIERINPDRIQLNTAVRPPAEEYAYAVPSPRLEEIARMLGPKAEVVARTRDAEIFRGSEARLEEVLEMLRRRPCTLDDVADGLGIARLEAVKFIQKLMADGEIDVRRSENRPYYTVRKA